MKKYFLLLVTLLGLLTTACDNSFEEPKKETPTGSPIAMIEEQMSSIKASLPKLQNTANEAKALVAEPMSKTRGDGNNGVKSMIEALEERIKALEEYIAGGGEGTGWIPPMPLWICTRRLLHSLQSFKPR